MDKKKVVTMKTIFDKFQNIYSEIRKEKGSFFLFMVLKMDEYTDKWSIMVSAPWTTGDVQRNSFNYIAKKVTDLLSKEEVSDIARIGIFSPDEHLVKLITNSIRNPGGSSIKLENTKINGYQIHEAYVYESNPPNVPSA